MASNMKLYRKMLGMSQAKLAEMTDTTDNYITLIETGRRFPSIAVLENIAMALNVDILELFSIKPDKTPEKQSLRAAILADIEQILTIRLGK